MMALIIRNNLLSKFLLAHSRRCKAIQNIKTAGIIVIGDEILKGEVLDTNSNYVTKALHKLGVRVDRISVIGDKVDEIGDEVKIFTSKYDYVITTGGIGPTHDDVTFEGVAKAFQEKLIAHPLLVEICSRYYKTEDLKAPGMKLVFVPQSSKLTFGDDGVRKVNYPNIRVNNVYIFPGIPQFLQKSLDILGPKLFSSQSKFYTKNLYFKVTEQLIVNMLDQIVKEYPQVTVGSYPEISNEEYKVKITIESTNPVETDAATNKLLQLIPSDFIAKL